MTPHNTSHEPPPVLNAHMKRIARGRQSARSWTGTAKIGGTTLFWRCKRLFDLSVAVALLPWLLVMTLVLLVLNPLFNPGSVFYVQPRMGRGCKPFPAFKFRTMSAAEGKTRGPDDPVEHHRITPLGGLLRRTRFDELPQILNILRGEMSLVGPRPDFFGHARVYMRAIPEYRDRHRIRPGLSGLAQVELGYAEGMEAARAKAEADLDYIERASFAFDLYLLWRTALVILRAEGK